jgi:hypothetical protein
MFSQSKIAALFIAVVAVAVVQGFAPVVQPRVASNTELGAFFFQKSLEKSPTLSLETKTKSNPLSMFGKKTATATAVKEAPPAKKKFPFGLKKDDAKKSPIKKVVAKKTVAKKVAVKKVVARKPVVKKTVAKKAAAKKPVVKKAVAKKVVAKKPAANFKNNFVTKNSAKKTSLTIYERVCHIN